MSIQYDVSFQPMISDYAIAKFIHIDKNICPRLCLTTLGCQLVMYSPTDSSCTIYNSTNGPLQPGDGHIIYTVLDETPSASSTESITTSTSTDDASTSTTTTALTSTTTGTTTTTSTIKETTTTSTTTKTTTTSTTTETTTSSTTTETTTTSTTTGTTTTSTTTKTTTTSTTTDTTTSSTTTETTITSTTTETTTTSSTTDTTTSSTTTDDTTTKQVTIETVPTCVTGNFPSFGTDLIALWRFDNNAYDAQELYHGTIIGDTYFGSKGYINGDLHFMASGSSYVEAPYINLISSSFTIELWLRINSSMPTNMVLVSQNDLILRIGSNNIVCISEDPPSVGTQLIENRWYHITLVYDVNLMEQRIYINGYLDSISQVELISNTSNAFYIGSLNGTSEFFNGEIDHLSITNRVKSACEILRDASLIASYSFSPPVIEADSGPYSFNGFIAGTMDGASGRVGDGFIIGGSNTYFQVSGMTGLTTTYGGFSFTLFIAPSSIYDCVLIYLSGTSDASDLNQARPYLGIDSFGRLVAELAPSLVIVTPANILAGQWNHVALTYSYAQNRVSLYYNGSLQISLPGPSPSYNPPIIILPIFVTLANALEGSNGSVIQAQPFLGSIDEFNIWNRELNASEVYAAANPD